MPSRLVVTSGMGIGPEVAAKALSEWRAPVLVLGERAPWEAAARDAGLSYDDRGEQGTMPDSGVAFAEPALPEGPPSAVEPVPLRAIRAAVRLCLGAGADAVVTGPIHKARLVDQGFSHRGHTEFLAELCGGGRPVMAFAGPGFGLALASTHIPLREVSAHLTLERVERAIVVAAQAWRGVLGRPPRVAVCGVNPHAGESGLLGREEIEVIRPASGQAAATLGREAEIVGPISAETAFTQARAGAFDVVIAMYHDQGLVPLKALSMGQCVNWTLGLPIVRTSVDHGTADDLVGTGRADASSMTAALGWADRIVTARTGQ